MITRDVRYLRKGMGPVVVLQHGFLSGAEYWSNQIEALSDRFDVIAPNLPGFAGAPGPTPDRIEQFGKSVIDLLDQLQVSEFTLLGHSMGGMIAQQIALDYPDRLRQLILYGTGPNGTLPGRFEPIETSKQRVIAEGPGSTVPSTVASWFLQGDQDPSYAMSLRLANFASADSMVACYDAWQHWNVRARLGEIDVPTLVLWADHDGSYEWAQPEALWRSIPSTQLGIIPGAAHNAHLERPKLFNQMLLGFLDPDNR